MAMYCRPRPVADVVAILVTGVVAIPVTGVVAIHVTGVVSVTGVDVAIPVTDFDDAISVTSVGGAVHVTGIDGVVPVINDDVYHSMSTHNCAITAQNNCAHGASSGPSGTDHSHTASLALSRQLESVHCQRHQ